MTEQITPSTGNVFEDVGFPGEEAENLKVRSVLMGKLRSIIEEEDLTQARAAEIFGVTQPRVSDLVRGKIELFSIDALVNMLGSAGRTVDVTVRPATGEAA